VNRHRPGPDQADVLMGGRVVVELSRRFMAEVEEGHLLDDVEREEAHRREGHGQAHLAAHQLHRLGQEIKEGGPDSDAGTYRDDVTDLPHEAKSHDPAGQRGQDGSRRHGDQERRHK